MDSKLDKLTALTQILIQEGQRLNITVGGLSMYPYMRPNDVAQIEACAIENIISGEIVVFKLSGKLIAHRVLKIKKSDNKTELITKGDGTYRKDAPVNSEMFVGRITSFNRNGHITDLTTRNSKQRHKFWTFIAPISFLPCLIYRIRIKVVIFVRKHKLW